MQRFGLRRGLSRKFRVFFVFHGLGCTRCRGLGLAMLCTDLELRARIFR